MYSAGFLVQGGSWFGGIIYIIEIYNLCALVVCLSIHGLSDNNNKIDEREIVWYGEKLCDSIQTFNFQKKSGACVYRHPAGKPRGNINLFILISV